MSTVHTGTTQASPQATQDPAMEHNLLLKTKSDHISLHGFLTCQQLWNFILVDKDAGDSIVKALNIFR